MASDSGSGAPYWYEWTVGLCNIVDMLHSDSDIESVTLQAFGTKGWDDVRVQRSGRREWYQVKHSRAENNLTFGSLVTVTESDPSLLSSLFAAWRELNVAPADRCILFTNREAGTTSSRSKSGVARPPLLQFASWLAASAAKAHRLADIEPQQDWLGGWGEWMAQLAGSSDGEILRFFKTFHVETNQSDLDALAAEVLENLAVIFGVDVAKARPLLQALDSALRVWSRDGKPVTAERVMDALALDAESVGEHRAPPPPAPFFPSREPFVADLERRLARRGRLPGSVSECRTGSGKTSALSELANRRVDNNFEGVVGLRYFAFRPITPETPLIAPDAGRYVKAEMLWFDLLRQLRRGLSGRLQAYRVPVRDELLSWPQAREHVIRLAAAVGRELGRPFVIVVDGIDHAARAALEDPAAAKEFFDSLPSPEEVAMQPIRLLLAGQPAENYPQYPAWLRSPHPAVEHLALPKLGAGDISIALEGTVPQFSAEQRPAAVRLIHEMTGGNTLGVVFAVAEAATCRDAEALRHRLVDRELQSGITSYYGNIWRHACAISRQPPSFCSPVH
jgi:hypothetical protein